MSIRKRKDAPTLSPRNGFSSAVLEALVEPLLVERDGVVVFANLAQAKLLGYETAPELIGRPLSEIMSPVSSPTGTSAPDCDCDNPTSDAYGIHRDGLFISLQEVSSSFTFESKEFKLRLFRPPAADLSQSVGEDTSALFDGPSEVNCNLMWMVNAEKRFYYFNKAWLRFTGGTLDQETGEGWMERIHPADRQGRSNRFALAFASRRPFRMHYRLRRFDGEYRVTSLGVPHCLPDGTFDGYSGTCVDVTDLRNARADLEKSHQQISTILNHSPSIISLKDLDGRYLMVNRRFEEICNVKREEAIGKTDCDLFPPAAAHGYASNDRAVLEGKKSLEFEETIPSSHGAHTFISNKFPLLDSEGAPYALCAILTDITEYQQMEHHLRESQKMEALGRLMGGVAHDFNNLLTAMMIYCGLLLDALSPESRLRRHVEEIRTAGERGAALVSQMLSLSRQQVLEPKVLNLTHVVLEMQDMLQRVIGEDINFITQCSDNLNNAKLDPAQIHQVILNLAINARDAMPTGGNLTITTKNIIADESLARKHVGIVPGPCVSLTVSDSGHGMDAEIRAHVFEPFFTTKEHGKGTGLGLSTVYGIVKQSSGFISIESEPGNGTTIEMLFPIADPDGVSRALKSENDLPQAQTLLLVEDEDLVRRSLHETLKLTGFEVLAASNGAEALKISGKHAGSIQLMITDLVMPGMSGRELAEQIVPTRPDMQILYMSGYIEDPRTRQLIGEGAAFFRKPFTPATLVGKIRSMLDHPRGLRP